MTYELLEKLDKAGFRANFSDVAFRESWLCKKGKECKSIDEKGRHKFMFACRGLYIPTLSELIEACGQSRFSMNWDGYNPHYAFKGYGNSNMKSGEGKSFEEAVAALYIALHSDKIKECEEKNTGIGKEIK